MIEIKKYEEERDFEHIINLCIAEKWVKFYGEKKESFRAALMVSDTFVAYCNDSCCGFVRGISDGAFTIYCCELIVEESYRRRGVGSAMLNALKEAHPQCCMDVISDNDAFYRANGFAAVGSGLRKN